MCIIRVCVYALVLVCLLCLCFVHTTRCWRCVSLFFLSDGFLFVCCCFSYFQLYFTQNILYSQHELVKIYIKHFTVTKRKPNKCSEIVIYCLINPKSKCNGLVRVRTSIAFKYCTHKFIDCCLFFSSILLSIGLQRDTYFRVWIYILKLKTHAELVQNYWDSSIQQQCIELEKL